MTPSDKRTAGEADLLALAEDGERQRFFAAHPELLARGTVESLCNQVMGLLRVDLDRAERGAATARWLAAELDDDYYRGRGLRASANVSILRRDYREALRQSEAALEQFERLADERETAITRSSAVQALISLGQYERAYEWAATARRIFRRLGDRLRLARLELNVGIAMARQDRFEEALRHFQSAHRDLEREGQPQDVGVCLRNIAVCLQDLNRFSEAHAAYQRARDFCQRHDLPLLLLEVDYNIAYLYYLQGEYTRAIKHFEVGRRRSEELQDHHHKALCDLDQSEIFLELNLVEEASRLAERAHTGFGALGMAYETAKALTNLGIALSRRGNPRRALALLEEARDIFLAEGNQVWPATIDLYRSLVLFSEGRFFEAAQFASGALDSFVDAALPSKTAMCEILLARLALESGDPTEARQLCGSALARLESLRLPALEHQVCAVLGQAEEMAGDRRAAAEAYREAQAKLESLRSHLQTDELRIAFLEDKLAVYESLVWLGLGDRPGEREKEAAFRDIEKSKSRSLADLMAFRAHAIPSKSDLGDLVEHLRSLREELSGYYRQIDRKQHRGDAGSRRLVAELRQQAHVQEEQLLRTLRSLQATDQEFSSLQDAATVDLEHIRERLPEDSVLIEYYFARNVIYGCVLSRQQFDILPVSAVAHVRELHRALQFQLSKFLLKPDYLEQFEAFVRRATRTHLRALHEELIAPFARHIEGRHLIVVPHDFLHFVPFHALLDGDRHLIDRHSVSYAPSASVYYLCADKQARSEGAALVMGVADERAPLIRREAETVARTVPGARLLLGADADEASLRRHGETSRIVHLATHGYFRRDNPMFSAIQLGDTRLSLFDLYNLKLNAELVVLSGCGTGLNAVVGADEQVGLTRGLLYAGASSLVVTLWDVHDESTARFMQRFYSRLMEKPHPAEALRRAMLELREAYPHPYYWAPFMLIGRFGGEGPPGAAPAG